MLFGGCESTVRRANLPPTTYNVSSREKMEKRKNDNVHVFVATFRIYVYYCQCVSVCPSVCVRERSRVHCAFVDENILHGMYSSMLIRTSLIVKTLVTANTIHWPRKCSVSHETNTTAFAHRATHVRHCVSQSQERVSDNTTIRHTPITILRTNNGIEMLKMIQGKLMNNNCCSE